MTRRTGDLRRRLGRVLAAALCALAASGAPAPAAAAEYTLGVVPPFEARKLFEIWRPIALALERRTGHTFRLVTTLPMKEFEQEYLRGRFDFVYMNPYFVARTARTVGYLPLVRDRLDVRGALVVRKGGPYRSPRDLAGKRVAFHGVNAAGACLLMRAELKDQFGVEVRPVYVRTAPNAALHVAKGLVDAAGVPDQALPLLDRALRDQLEVLHRTAWLPALPLAAHPRVPAADRERVRGALLELGATEEGRALLAKVPLWEPVAATMEEYLAIERLGLDAWYDAGARMEDDR